MSRERSILILQIAIKKCFKAIVIIWIECFGATTAKSIITNDSASNKKQKESLGSWTCLSVKMQKNSPL